MKIFDQFFMVGLSHRESSVEKRGLLSIPKDQHVEFLVNFSLRFGLKGIVLLSTCNRFEIYCEKDIGIESVLCHLSKFFKASIDDDSMNPYQKIGLDFVRHLFRVTSGLSSMLLGENEVLGQVRSAYLRSFHCGKIGSLHKVFQQSIHVGKLVRANTDISRGGMSIASVCVDLVKKDKKFSIDSSILVVGAGEVARNFIRDLFSNGYKNIILCNRTLHKSKELATNYNLRVVPLEDFTGLLSEVVVVVTATSSTEYLISSSTVLNLYREDKKIPIFIDLSVPNCIDPNIMNIDEVTLYTLDHIDQMVQKNIKTRKGAFEKAESIVEKQLEKFYRQSRKHTIFSLLQRALGNEGLNNLQRFLLKLGENLIGSPLEKDGFIDAVKKIRSPKDFPFITNFFIQNESISKEFFSHYSK